MAHRYHEMCHVTQWVWFVDGLEGWPGGDGWWVSGLVAFSSVFLLNSIDSLNTTCME